jgi:hypothetical protein
MRVILASVLLALLIAVGAGVILFRAQKPVYEAYSLPSVRIGDPGHNLVGPQWTGDVRAEHGDDMWHRAAAESTSARPQ